MGRALNRPSASTRSLWDATFPDDHPDRPRLPGSRDADVAIVGGGLTGLWTAYYLRRADPGLRIVVLEAETTGFGASGRNGGWVSALFPASLGRLATLPGSSREKALAMYGAMRATVDEVGAVAAAEGVDCHFHKGGTISLARSRAQRSRAQAEVAHARQWGLGEDHLRFLDREEATAVVSAAGGCGATFTPHCAVIHPRRLVRGLAVAVERSGVTVHEHSPVLEIAPHRARTATGDVRADIVVRATEGYTAALPGHRRALAPIYSMMVATEPLDDATWERIGLDDRPSFTDQRHLLVYGQRTLDGRLAFGGRGAPYHFGSRVSAAFDQSPRVFARLRSTLVDMFPVLSETRLTHAWGGPLGVPRDWCASVGLDRASGLAWAGGYVGDGVSTTNLAGRTLADLVLDRHTELTDLPWVGHRSRGWEPEPLRWVGVNAGLRAMAAADVEERCTGRPSRLARVMAPLLGGH